MHLSIRTNIFIYSFSISIIVSVSLFILFTKNIEKELNKSYNKSIKNQVDSLVSGIDGILESNNTSAHPLTRESYSNIVVNFVNNAAYNNDDNHGYYFLTMHDGIQIATGSENKNLVNNKVDTRKLIDLKGRNFGLNLLNHSKSNSQNINNPIFTPYTYTKSALDKNGIISTNQYNKISYARTFKNLPWFIGTGIYADGSVNKVFSELNSSLLKLTLFILVIISILSYIFSAALTRPIELLSRVAKAIEHGEFSKWEVINSNSKEVKKLTNSLKNMTKVLERRTKDLEESKTLAESANKAKSNFLANMSHELRTPLNAILGYSEMLQEEAQDLGHVDYIPDLERINNSGNHLLELINEILDLSKIESGKMNLFIEEININSMIDDVRRTVEPLVRKNNNTLHINIDYSVNIMHADLTKTKQLLLNLLSNASKFTENGDIYLNLKSDFIENKNYIKFIISDTGIGIKTEQMKNLFKEFSQADNSTTRKYGGTGLGLVLTKKFCEMMGGEINVESEYGKGTKFSVIIPKEILGKQAKAPQKNYDKLSIYTNVTSEKQNTVLVIDDDYNVRDMMYRNLTKEGVNIAFALNGEEGIELAKQLKPSVITLDITMPNRDGWSILNELKGNPELRDIPVVLVTIVDDKEKGYALGAADYLLKPINWDNLVTVVKKYADQINEDSILIVEDDPNARDIMSRIISEAGWKVIEASNGKEALRKIKSGLPGLILLDLMMPEMDGFEFMDKFRSYSFGADVPVIIITAKDLTNSDRELLSGRVSQILLKGSYSLEDLLAEVKRYLPINI